MTFGIAFLGCLLLPVVHNNNDALPVTEGMMTSGTSAADVRQALACVPAVVCINSGFNVLYNAIDRSGSSENLTHGEVSSRSLKN